MESHVFCAERPQAMKTIPAQSSLAKTWRSASAVNDSQPFLEWEPALWARTVKLAFSHKTPSSATRLRSLPKHALATPNAPVVVSVRTLRSVSWIQWYLDWVVYRCFSTNQGVLSEEAQRTKDLSQKVGACIQGQCILKLTMGLSNVVIWILEWCGFGGLVQRNRIKMWLTCPSMTTLTRSSGVSLDQEYISSTSIIWVRGFEAAEIMKSLPGG